MSLLDCESWVEYSREPGWLWWSGVAVASGEAATARRSGWLAPPMPSPGETVFQLHEPLRRRVQLWLERARAEVGSAKADQLGVEGSQLSSSALMDEALRKSVNSAGFAVFGHGGGTGVCDAIRWASSVRERTPSLR
jgi:hypothetical protein